MVETDTISALYNASEHQHRTLTANTGIGHQNIKPSELSLTGHNRPGDAVRVGDIGDGLQGTRTRLAEYVRNRHRTVCIYVADRHNSAFAGKRPGDSSAKARPRARNQRDFPVKSSHSNLPAPSVIPASE